jgi:hypothetical protein
VTFRDDVITVGRPFRATLETVNNSGTLCWMVIDLYVPYMSQCISVEMFYPRDEGRAYQFQTALPRKGGHSC